MKTVRKTLIAAAVATAMTPAAVMADTTLFGNFDIAVGVESAAETAIAVTDSPAGDNVIGVEGNIDLENGNAVTYQYIVDVDLDGDGSAGFVETYHAYVGYKWDSVELRAGTQDLPERLVMDSVDHFTSTYGDQQNLIGSGTTADSSLMVLGGNDTIKYAVSLDTSNEDSNDKDANDGIRFGAMADFSVNENTSIAVGIESLKDSYDTVSLAANVGVSDNAEITLGFQQVSYDKASTASITPLFTGATPLSLTDKDVTTILVGGSLGLSDMVTLKAQVGVQDLDTSNVDDRKYFAIGADFEMAENVTTYVLAASGSDFGLTTTSEQDTSGDSSVVAGGIKLSF